MEVKTIIMTFKGKQTSNKIILLIAIGLCGVIMVGIISNRYLSGLLNEVMTEAKSDSEIMTAVKIQDEFANAETALLSYKLYSDSVYYYNYHKASLSIDSMTDALLKGHENKEISILMKSISDRALEKRVLLDSLLTYDLLPNYQGVLKQLESDLSAIPVVKGEKKRIVGQQKVKEEYETQAGSVFSKLSGDLKNVVSKREQDYAWIHAALVQVSDDLSQIVNELSSKKKALTLEKGSDAEKQAEEVKTLITAFSIFTALLMVLLVLLIMQYQKRSKESKKALEEAKQNAEKLAKTREDFMANMSHEIRTPMNAIAGFSDELLKRELPPEIFEEIVVIKKSSDHLLHIINEILDFSSLEQGAMKLELFGFNPKLVVEDACGMLKGKAKERGNTIEISCEENVPNWVVSDPSRMRQILLNLVGNAVKFTENETVNVHLSVQELQSDYAELVISVKDKGIGIDQSQQRHVFDMFVQASSETFRKYGGSGLGLSITKRIVDLFGGSISVQSELGEGSEFIVVLPVEIVEEGDAVNEMKQVDFSNLNLSNLSVLIVDDNEFNRKLLRTILTRRNARIHELSDGSEVLDYVLSNKIDVILMDLRMPRTNGVMATRMLKDCDDEVIRSIPVIGVSATVSGEEKADAIGAGMVAFINKPYTESRLMKILQNVLPAKYQIFWGEKLDFTELESLSNGKSDFVLELLEIFLKTTGEGIDKLDQAFKDQDLNQIREVAHQIASPNKHIGAKTLYAHLKKLEEYAIKKLQWSELRSIMIEVDEEYKSVRRMVQDKINELKSKI